MQTQLHRSGVRDERDEDDLIDGVATLQALYRPEAGAAHSTRVGVTFPVRSANRTYIHPISKSVPVTAFG